MIWTAAMLKNKKRPYLGKGLTDLHEIWRGIAHWPSEGYLQLKFWTLKNPRWPTTAILRNQKNGYFSETACPICSKFGKATNIGPPMGMGIKMSNF